MGPVNLENIKIDNVLQLRAFLSAILVFPELEKYLTDAIEMWDSEDLHQTFPFDLYDALMEGNGYYVDPSRYPIQANARGAAYIALLH